MTMPDKFNRHTARDIAQLVAKNVAAEIRAAVKKQWPGIRWSVTHLGYADGRTDVTIRWTGGPSTKEVEGACPKEARDLIDSVWAYHKPSEGEFSLLAQLFND